MTTTVAPELTPEQTRRLQATAAHTVLGRVMDTVPTTIDISNWWIQYGAINIMLSTKPDDAARRDLRSLAGLFDFAYAEADHGQGQNKATASGEIDGVQVMFWKLVAKCACGCHHSGGAS